MKNSLYLLLTDELAQADKNRVINLERLYYGKDKEVLLRVESFCYHFYFWSDLDNITVRNLSGKFFFMKLQTSPILSTFPSFVSILRGNCNRNSETPIRRRDVLTRWGSHCIESIIYCNLSTVNSRLEVDL